MAKKECSNIRYFKLNTGGSNHCSLEYTDASLSLAQQRCLFSMHRTGSEPALTAPPTSAPPTSSSPLILNNNNGGRGKKTGVALSNNVKKEILTNKSNPNHNPGVSLALPYRGLVSTWICTLLREGHASIWPRVLGFPLATRWLPPPLLAGVGRGRGVDLGPTLAILSLKMAGYSVGNVLKGKWSIPLRLIRGTIPTKM